MVRLLRRAIAKYGSVPIDLKVVSGRKHGWLTKEPEVGRGWTTGLGDKIPTYRFTYERVKGGGQGTFELPAAGVDNLMTLTKHNGEFLITNPPDKVNEMHVPGEPAMWIGLVKKALKAGKKIYFASGGNEVVAVNDEVSPGIVWVSLENRKTGKKQTYTIASSKSDEWTLQKFEDGHRLTMVQNIKEEEEVDLNPPIYTMFWKLKKAGKNVYFKNRAGREIQLNFAKTGLSSSGNDAIWFFSSHNSPGNAITWKTGDNIGKLTLKKKPGTDDWLLFDRTAVKLKESKNEPMIVTLMQKRLNNDGAIKVEISDMLRKSIRGWITEPIEFMPAQLWGSRDGWKCIIHADGGGKKVLWLDGDADEYYTLRTGTDGNGNKFVKLTVRDGADDET